MKITNRKVKAKREWLKHLFLKWITKPRIKRSFVNRAKTKQERNSP